MASCTTTPSHTHHHNQNTSLTRFMPAGIMSTTFPAYPPSYHPPQPTQHLQHPPPPAHYQPPPLALEFSAPGPSYTHNNYTHNTHGLTPLPSHHNHPSTSYTYSTNLPNPATNSTYYHYRLPPPYHPSFPSTSPPYQNQSSDYNISH